MNERDRRRLCARVVERFSLPDAATYKQACQEVGSVLSELLDATVELRFVAIRDPRLSGATLLHRDGTYLVYCAKSGSWYHRLGILLHELAHLVLGHRPVELDNDETLRHFLPHLPVKMARILAARTCHSDDEEREAEEFADELLAQLTDRHKWDEFASAEISPHVLRIAEDLANHRCTRE